MTRVRGRPRGRTAITQSFSKAVCELLARGPLTSREIADATRTTVFRVHARMMALVKSGIVSFEYVRTGGHRNCQWRLNSIAEPFTWVPA